VNDNPAHKDTPEISRPAGPRAATESAQTATNRSLRALILTYHETLSSSSPYQYSVTRDQLDQQLGLVAKHCATPGGAGKAVVTFDDGHVSNYENALPLLDQHVIPGVFFVIAGRLGIRHDYMTWDQLRDVVARGHQVQSHGWSHRYLTELSASDLMRELRDSKQVLEDRLGAEVTSLSVPHGRWNATVLQACSQAGYRRVYTSDPWVYPEHKYGVEIWGRYMVRRTLSPEHLQHLLSFDARTHGMVRINHCLKENLKRVFGNQMYHRVWRLLAHKRPR